MNGDLFISCEIWKEAESVPKIICDICRRIDIKNYNATQYASNLESIGIIVNCFPNDFLVAGWGKPRKYNSYKNKYADIRLPIPYEQFINSCYEEQYLMVVKNVVESLQIIDEKCKKSKKGMFNSEKVIDDLLQKLGITSADITGVVGVLSDDEYAKIVSG